METVRLDALFVEQRPTRNTGAYTNHHNDSNKSVGSALARFERSSLPDHKSTRTVMLRFLKIVAPVKCVLWSYSAVKVLDPGFGGFPWHIR